VDVTRYQFHLAAAQREQGRMAEAVATLRKACLTAERDYGVQHPRAARALAKLSDALAAVGEAGEAEETGKRAAAIRAQAFG